MSKRPADDPITPHKKPRTQFVGCPDRDTCFCIPFKFDNGTCKECLRGLQKGDCVKRSKTGRGHAHVYCPGSDKPLITGLCERKSKYGRCGCDPALRQYLCHNCKQDIKKGQCMIHYKLPNVHTRCPRDADEHQSLPPRALNFDNSQTTTRSELLGVGDVCIHLKNPRKVLEIIDIEPGESSQTMAVCNAFVLLKDTTMKKAAQKLPSDYPWKYAVLPDLISLPLTELHSVNIAPEDLRTDLIWEPHSKAKDGFWTEFSFLMKNTASKKFSIERRPVVMDLFAGGGGIDLAFQKAGLDMKYAVEKDEMAVATIRHNSVTQRVLYQEDARTMLENIRKGDADLPTPGDVDCIHASPPCQGHSWANPFRGSRRAEENNNLTLLCIEYLEFFRPKVFTFENVMGIVDESSRPIFEELIASLLALGYQVRGSAINAMDYGDPQSRQRVILIAVQSDCELPRPPSPTHGEGTGRPHKTSSDAIGDLETARPYRSILEIPKGHRIIPNHTMLGPENQKAASTAVGETREQSLRADRPSQTLLCAKPVKHYNPNLERAITNREKARLQSFPDDFVFIGTHSQQSRQIGNAVPIGLATAIGKTVFDCFDFFGGVSCHPTE